MVRVFAIGLFVTIVATARANDGPLAAPAERGLLDRIYTDADGPHKYVVFLPQGSPPQDGWPVILFLHGAGERGTDGRRQLSAGLGPLVKLRSATFPAVVVFPQSEDFDGPILRSWSPRAADGSRALAILKSVEASYPINPARRVLTGWSMGAFGAWGLAAADPKHWSAVVAVSGGGKPEWAPQFTALPIWAFHGDDDRVVSIAGTRKMVQAVREAGGRVLFSEIPGGRHDIWRRVYDSDVVLNWMLAPDATDRALEEIQLPEDRTLPEDAPFVPAMMIERALTLRLGKQAIEIIAAGLPSALDKKGLTGSLDDVDDRVELSGRNFHIQFRDLTFSGELDRTEFRLRGPDRVQAEVGMRMLRLHIGQIHVTDGKVGFTAGPAEVVIGHREPVWLRCEVRPAVADNRLELKLLRSSFVIPDYNWYVREPQNIRLQGDWLTEEEVKTAVVGGIYVRRDTIEKQVLAGLPGLLNRFGDEIDLSPLERLVAALWPLPVYQPDVRVLPESIVTDTEGVSLTFSVALAAFDPTQPPVVKIVRASGPAAHEVARTTDLSVGVAIDVLDHISSLLAGTDAARIYTSDIPEQPFVELMDPAALSAAFPQARLSTVQEVQTSMFLQSPLHLQPLHENPADDGHGVQVMIEASQLALHVSALENRTLSPASNVPAPGAPASSETSRATAIFDGVLSLRQPLSLEPVVDANGRPMLKIAWKSKAEIAAISNADSTSGESNHHADAEAIVKLFGAGWERWTQAQAEQTAELPNVAFGTSSMMLRDLSWSGANLSATFGPAATRIVNASDAPVSYRVCGPHTNWSETRLLAAGATVSYESGTEIRVRAEQHWEFDEVLLPAGSRWECRTGNRRGRFQWVRLDQEQSTATTAEVQAANSGHER